jgi:hypothetical protein
VVEYAWLSVYKEFGTYLSIKNKKKIIVGSLLLSLVLTFDHHHHHQIITVYCLTSAFLIVHHHIHPILRLLNFRDGTLGALTESSSSTNVQY